MSVASSPKAVDPDLYNTVDCVNSVINDLAVTSPVTVKFPPTVWLPVTCKLPLSFIDPVSGEPIPFCTNWPSSTCTNL